VKNYALSGLEKNIQNILVEQISISMHHKYGVISKYVIIEKISIHFLESHFCVSVNT